MIHLRYLRYLIRHKWFVFLAGLRLGVPLVRLIVHDWTKFLPDEWLAYARYFYGERALTGRTWFRNGQLEPELAPPPSVAEAFDRAWNHHQKRNPHHWQYWLLTPDQPRPNFTFQSHDDGLTHVVIGRAQTGEVAAEVRGPGCACNAEAAKELNAELKRVPQALAMPDADRREMLADWIGAGRALGKPDTWDWYKMNRDNIYLHPATREWVELMLQILAEADELEARHKSKGIIA